MESAIRLPKRSQRLVNVGRTGSGKTVGGLWHLSNFSYNEPWVIIDFKTDEHINSIKNAEHVDLGWTPNKKSRGIYIVHPLPFDTKAPSKDEPSPVDSFLMRLWAHEDIGIFTDEGFMLGTSAAYDAIQTQGRSKRIPTITNTQRPVWVSRFVFSEADFIQVYHLNDDRDKQTIEAFTPIDYDELEHLDEFHSYYFDVGKNRLVELAPVPPIEIIIKRIDDKLAVLRKERKFL